MYHLVWGWEVLGALMPLQASEPSGLPHSLRLVDKTQDAYSDPNFRQSARSDIEDHLDTRHAGYKKI